MLGRQTVRQSAKEEQASAKVSTKSWMLSRLMSLLELHFCVAVWGWAGGLKAEEACCSLGVLYQQQGDFANAVHHLERFFEIARSIGDRALVDKARVYLGIARGNSMLPKYLDVVTHDLDALLRWKKRRVACAS